jgi:hypothetical protein
VIGVDATTACNKLKDFLKNLMEKAGIHVNYQLQLTSQRPSTSSAPWKDSLKERVKEFGNDRMAHVLTTRAELPSDAKRARRGRVSSAAAHIGGAQFGNDPWAGEVACTAQVSLYYDLTLSGFVDSVEKILMKEILEPLRLGDDIKSAIWELIHEGC